MRKAPVVWITTSCLLLASSVIPTTATPAAVSTGSSTVPFAAPAARVAAVAEPGAPPSQQGPGSVNLIGAEQLRDYLFFVASDEMEGRRTPSRGLKTTARFLGTLLSRWGLKPAGDDGTFFQRIELESTKVDAGASFVEIDGERFAFGDSFLASPVAAHGEAGLVYAGHGWVVPSKGIDPYAGLDVAGKVIVVTAGRFPRGVSRADLTGEAGVDWMRPAQYAAQQGAAGIISIPSSRALAQWDRNRERAVERGSVQVVAFSSPESDDEVAEITASEALVRALFAGTPVSAEQALGAPDSGETGASFEFPAARTVRFNVAVETDRQFTQNVVAIAEGSDPELRNEYVAIGAHYDHVGIRNPLAGDAIYNGADDDGSGTVSVLAMAEAFARGERPRRSILFVWHAGEEVGLWGSRYVNEFPPVPVENIVAQLNIDMIGRSRAPGDDSEANRELTGPNEVYIIGPHVQSDEMGAIVEEVNDAYLDLELNYLYDAIDHPTRFFFRSDHVNYARNGIPIVFFFTGVHEDYHRPSDHPDKIDYGKMEKVARTIYATAWDLATRDGRPAVNPDLPPELQRRR